MNQTPTAPAGREHWSAGMRVALVSAGLMLAVPLGARLAARFGWVDHADLAGRAHLAILAAFIVLTGNTIPKRLFPLACRNTDAVRMQSFLRFSGWVWVLAGLAFGLASLLLTPQASTTATLIIMPLAIALIAYRWIDLRTTRRSAS
jgi:Sec-independent protein secretion pathway component TatC